MFGLCNNHHMGFWMWDCSVLGNMERFFLRNLLPIHLVPYTNKNDRWKTKEPHHRYKNFEEDSKNWNSHHTEIDNCRCKVRMTQSHVGFPPCSPSVCKLVLRNTLFRKNHIQRFRLEGNKDNWGCTNLNLVSTIHRRLRSMYIGRCILPMLWTCRNHMKWTLWKKDHNLWKLTWWLNNLPADMFHQRNIVSTIFPHQTNRNSSDTDIYIRNNRDKVLKWLLEVLALWLCRPVHLLHGDNIHSLPNLKHTGPVLGMWRTDVGDPAQGRRCNKRKRFAVPVPIVQGIHSTPIHTRPLGMGLDGLGVPDREPVWLDSRWLLFGDVHSTTVRTWYVSN